MLSNLPPSSPRRPGVLAGFTMVEVIAVAAVIGILSAVAITTYTNMVSQSQDAVAGNVKETLNTAVHRYNEVNGELIYPPTGSGEDELTVLHTLQYRNPLNPAPGSPYVLPDWDPVESSSLEDYRIAWMGTLYELIPPGTSGTGLRVAFDGSDMGASYVFPAGYTPLP